MKRIGIEIAGWTLVLVGIAALVLPGPGLLALAGGLLILSQQYEWAEKRVDPVLLRGLRGAADSVETWPRIIASSTFAVLLIACGVLWIIKPPTPDWWPLSDFWWLPGGIWTGVTQIGSGLFALGLIGYSFRRFHGKPEARAALDGEISRSDDRRDDEPAQPSA